MFSRSPPRRGAGSRALSTIQIFARLDCRAPLCRSSPCGPDIERSLPHLRLQDRIFRRACRVRNTAPSSRRIFAGDRNITGRSHPIFKQNAVKARALREQNNDSHRCAGCMILRTQETRPKWTAFRERRPADRAKIGPFRSEWPTCSCDRRNPVTTRILLVCAWRYRHTRHLFRCLCTSGPRV